MNSFFKKYAVNSRSCCIILSLALLSSCGIYSFSGGSIDSDVKTISIDNFNNESGGGPPNLSQTFTEKLKNYYRQNSKLDIVKNNGDWHLEGRIVSYGISPIAPQGEVGASTRLTIGLQVKFVNIKNEKASFDQPFSFYDDFLQGQTLSEVETGLIDRITEKLVYDIFTKTTSNW